MPPSDTHIRINPRLSLPVSEVDIQAIRAQGAGGQNVNKVSSAIHLRFDIPASSLPELYKTRLLAQKDSRISREGVLVIKAQRFRSQDKNRTDAIERLRQLILGATVTRKARKATKPSLASQRRRVDKKTQRGHTKRLRGKVET